MINSLFKTAIIAAVLVGSSAVYAKSSLQLNSNVFVEREKIDAYGKKSVTLEQPTKVLPGDNLVFVVKYTNSADQVASNFTVTNPMPRAVRFNGTADGLEIASVDGGKSWGFLSQLKVTSPDGSERAANKADVTHIKWKLNQTLAPGEGGKLIFRGVVK